MDLSPSADILTNPVRNFPLNECSYDVAFSLTRSSIVCRTIETTITVHHLQRISHQSSYAYAYICMCSTSQSAEKWIDYPTSCYIVSFITLTNYQILFEPLLFVVIGD